MPPDPSPLEVLARGYALLGDLFGHGLDDDGIAAWRQVPGAVPLLEGATLEDAAEAHTRVTLLEIAPFESAFRSAEGLLGGDVAAAVAAVRDRTGVPRHGREPADHLGEELSWVAFLAGAEADAARDGEDPGPARRAARLALDRHLLAWLPAFAASLDTLPLDGAARIYPFAAGLALDLALHHRRALGGPVAAPPPGPDIPDVLGEPGADLRAVAEHLVAPARAGGSLARGTLAAIGRSLDLPTPFGARAHVLTGLLRSAARFDRLPDLVQALQAVLAAWDRRYRAVADAGFAAHAAPWRERVSDARRLLGRLAEPGGPRA